MVGPLLDRDTITDLLREVAAELDAQGHSGKMFLVGGAAIALAFGRNRTTRDVDAIFEPKEFVYKAARAVAARRGLPADWLNDGVKGFLLGDDPNATVAFDEPGLSVQTASAPYLFTMKALAARVDRDAGDLVFLYHQCGFATVEEALGHVEATAPPGLLQPKTVFLLRELLHDDADLVPPGSATVPATAVHRAGASSEALCDATLGDGRPCTFKAKPGSTRCGIHSR